MARDDERHGVVPERRADRPDRLRAADLGGDPAVGPDLAARDLEGLVPDVAFEVGVAAQVEVDADPPVAVEAACDRRGKALGHPLDGMCRAPGPGQVVRLERRVVIGRLDRRDAQPVPGHDERPDRGVEAGVAVGQADLGEHVRGEAGRSRRAEAGQRRLHGSIVGGHAVISSRSCRWAASNAVRNSASPRWTCALTVPSGRSRAMASSG